MDMSRFIALWLDGQRLAVRMPDDVSHTTEQPAPCAEAATA